MMDMGSSFQRYYNDTLNDTFKKTLQDSHPFCFVLIIQAVIILEKNG